MSVSKTTKAPGVRRRSIALDLKHLAEIMEQRPLQFNAMFENDKVFHKVVGMIGDLTEILGQGLGCAARMNKE